MLKVLNVSAHYGTVPVLRRVTLHVDPGERVCLLGANGAGKSTLLKVLSGMHRLSAGEIHFRGTPLQGRKPEEIVRMGLAQVPEARQLFPNLTVRENLELGGYIHGRRELRHTMDEMMTLFPILRDRQKQKAGTLSGGEQQMLSIARALMTRPKLLVLDEPSLGLAPLIVEEIYATLEALNRQGTTILLVEQNALGALDVCHRGYVMETGRIVLSGTARELAEHDEVQRAYLGRDYRHKWER
ncbi:amino acid/amide ABC transporter ATP-binding protein 2, HAAT family [Desulfacinum hydrothermale DSM 13146]|uniref:Amino acid/amide ABC transporter ATP-binding protein 2, HAAT family n=1 Tax=Desulfacinum hydrothermale DSM 13146 TaxID=1121390 RepID=A0A1W1X1H7_9BACT|nr:ABC transporter ATP-binding protein [Desulfacinum hydrothermale]SMC17693.1 amino acid/amide ABC transporter ATP-binding protein 2, HAAT family [Desulfacinum hydrothermale DSM 13146]